MSIGLPNRVFSSFRINLGFSHVPSRLKCVSVRASFRPFLKISLSNGAAFVMLFNNCMGVTLIFPSSSPVTRLAVAEAARSFDFKVIGRGFSFPNFKVTYQGVIAQSNFFRNNCYRAERWY